MSFKDLELSMKTSVPVTMQAPTKQHSQWIKRLALSFLILSYSATSYGKQLWSDNSLSFSRGTHYELGDNVRTIMTFEHVSGHNWGDIFMFVDRVKSDDGTNETYWELSPRLSTSKLFKTNFIGGAVNDVLITTTTEMATNVTNYLYGPAIDLDVPGFSVFQLNFYRRNNENQQDNWQFTPVWVIPFTIGNLELVYEGFADWSSGTDDHHAELNVSSELKVDIGAFWETPKTIFAGFKYIHIDNKFGIKDSRNLDTNESNLNAIIQFHF